MLDSVKIGRQCRIQRRRSSTRASTIPDGTSIGYDKDHDIARGFSVTDSGITVVGKGQVVTP
jgi:glucose-1-phosphate adenylyltransferase